MKKLMFLGLLLLASPAWAQQAGQTGDGPYITTSADVTAQACSGGNTIVIADSTPNANASMPRRMCAFLTNSHATIAARCGDINTSATQGLYLSAAGGGIVVCSPKAIYCCGVGGTTTINQMRTDR